MDNLSVVLIIPRVPPGNVFLSPSPTPPPMATRIPDDLFLKRRRPIGFPTPTSAAAFFYCRPELRYAALRVWCCVEGFIAANSPITLDV